MTDQGKANQAPGQQKTYTVTNPTTGEQRTVTQQQWREERLGQQGWTKPADLDETEPMSGDTSGT